VLLTAEATQPMAIVLHELATNASKYGALATAAGRIQVRWDWQQDSSTPRQLLLEWSEETNGPAAAAPSHAGYGVRAIRNLIPYELGGTVDLLFDASGLRCRMQLPAKRIRRGTPPVDLLRPPNSSPAARQPLAHPA
jgi:two-component sensor histidine kinase